MIMRIFQVIKRPGKEEEFSRFFHETAIPLMKSTEGIVDVLPGAARAETPREFSFVMVWDSLASLKAFVGEDYSTPHIDPAEDALVESRTIKHYYLVTEIARPVRAQTPMPFIGAGPPVLAHVRGSAAMATKR